MESLGRVEMQQWWEAGVCTYCVLGLVARSDLCTRVMP
jgi:hypothetical protein